MDKLKAFETFVSVATKGSLTAAARAEGVAPAIIGRRLDALEESLGVKLPRPVCRLVASRPAVICASPPRPVSGGGMWRLWCRVLGNCTPM
jgi:hypothetical protein